MITHKIIPSVDYNKWLKRLDTQLNKPTNQNLTKSTNKNQIIIVKLWGQV